MKITTKHTDISVKSLKIMEKFHRKISSYVFFAPKYDADSMKEKIDTIFESVQSALGMEGEMPLLHIKLYFEKEFKWLLADNGKRRCFYLYDYKTIYVNVDDIHTGMLAHEICHHIVDSWFGGPPPRKTAEFIATGVDRGFR
ncbi:hypothetical protein LCGC14_1035440 [marine sediment metagenome]|uniref:Uncharacterized protein n=1 Tax=marine sediment metagenome TaxID=412755 RepID=A0A0F9QBK6_9ZZZZ